MKEGLRNGMRIFIWVMGIVVMMLVGTMGYLKGIDSKGSDRSTAIAVVQTDVKHIQRTLQRIEKAVDK